MSAKFLLNGSEERKELANASDVARVVAKLSAVLGVEVENVPHHPGWSRFSLEDVSAETLSQMEGSSRGVDGTMLDKLRLFQKYFAPHSGVFLMSVKYEDGADETAARDREKSAEVKHNESALFPDGEHFSVNQRNLVHAEEKLNDLLLALSGKSQQQAEPDMALAQSVPFFQKWLGPSSLTLEEGAAFAQLDLLKVPKSFFEKLRDEKKASIEGFDEMSALGKRIALLNAVIPGLAHSGAEQHMAYLDARVMVSGKETVKEIVQQMLSQKPEGVSESAPEGLRAPESGRALG